MLVITPYWRIIVFMVGMFLTAAPRDMGLERKMRKEIGKSIDRLMTEYSLASLDKNAETFNQEIAYVQDRLYESLNSTSSFDTRLDLETFVLSDKDPIGRPETENISDYESFVEKVRDIQNDIISEFVEFNIAYDVDSQQNND